MPVAPHRILVAIAALLVLAAAAVARADGLVADPQAGTIDAWPAVRILDEGPTPRDAADVLAQASAFAAPAGPRANLGLRANPVWLRFAVDVPPGAGGAWVVSVDYASLDSVDFYVAGEPEGVRHARGGRAVPYAARPWPSNVHAAQFTLDAAQRYEVLLRVRTSSTAIVPVTLSTPAAFHAQEAGTQMLQGLLAGAALCLLVYSLAHWVSLRDAMYLHYALTLAGTTLFFVAYFGLGPQHLWGDSPWLAEKAAPLCILLGALPGGFLFVDRALHVRAIHPWMSLALRAGASIAGCVGLAFLLDAVGYRFAQAVATALGPMPMLLAVRACWTRVQDGDRVAMAMLVGWGVYAVGTLTMVGLLRGYVASSFWTQHAFQFSALFEMVVWMRVLGLRTESLRAAAQRAALEREALRSLAHTDALTGLPNRRGLTETLQRVLPSCAPDRMVAVYLLDLDGFKAVNDRHGHDAGDALLVAVARRLASLVRATDTVARLGGDEFVVVVADLNGEDEARTIGQKMLAGFRESFDAARQDARVGITIGYALAPSDGRDAAALLKRADAGMYAGKQAGGRRIARALAAVATAA